MASLGNILARAAGTPLTGRPVKFHLLVQTKTGELEQHEVDAVLYPVHEEARLDAISEARDFLRDSVPKEKQAAELDLRITVESNLRFIAKALRDPEDARRQFVLAQEMHLLRRGLVHDQMTWLQQEYTELLKSEYPEVFTQKDFDKTKEEAKGFTEGGPVEPGPSSP